MPATWVENGGVASQRGTARLSTPSPPRFAAPFPVMTSTCRRPSVRAPPTKASRRRWASASVSPCRSTRRSIASRPRDSRLAVCRSRRGASGLARAKNGVVGARAPPVVRSPVGPIPTVASAPPAAGPPVQRARSRESAAASGTRGGSGGGVSFGPAGSGSLGLRLRRRRRLRPFGRLRGSRAHARVGAQACHQLARHAGRRA